MFGGPLARVTGQDIRSLLRRHFGGGVRRARTTHTCSGPSPSAQRLARARAPVSPLPTRFGLPRSSGHTRWVLYDVVHAVLPPALRVIWRPTVRGLEHVPRS